MTSCLKFFSLILIACSLIACTSATVQTDSPDPANEIAEATATTAPTETPPPTNTPLPTATDTPAPTNTPAPTDTPTPTNTPEPTNTPTPTPTATPLPPSDLVSADNCYLPLNAFTNVGLGVPRY
ncbi:MAG: hypothetical protein AAGD96_16755, partial [Chloroflexota bacterium]